MLIFNNAILGIIRDTSQWEVSPLLMTLRQQRARWAVVTIVLAAYAVKLPMIPLEVGFLGWPFSLARSALTLLLAIPTGLIVERAMATGENKLKPLTTSRDRKRE